MIIFIRIYAQKKVGESMRVGEFDVYVRIYAKIRSKSYFPLHYIRASQPLVSRDQASNINPIRCFDFFKRGIDIFWVIFRLSADF